MGYSSVLDQEALGQALRASDLGLEKSWEREGRAGGTS